MRSQVMHAAQREKKFDVEVKHWPARCWRAAGVTKSSLARLCRRIGGRGPSCRAESEDIVDQSGERAPPSAPNTACSRRCAIRADRRRRAGRCRQRWPTFVAESGFSLAPAWYWRCSSRGLTARARSLARLLAAELDTLAVIDRRTDEKRTKRETKTTRGVRRSCPATTTTTTTKNSS